jgi:bile acid-coenzyme A ligase
VGEIVVHGPQVFRGYWKQPEATALSFVEHDGKRFFRTGDLGYYDEDGYLYLSDRSTDCIVSGGANVYPAEVEGALGAHPGVRTSAVIGLPDDDLGQKVVAIVEAEPGVTAEQLDAHLRELVAPYKRPRQYELTDQPLRDEAGKVRRSALRKARLEAAS